MNLVDALVAVATISAAILAAVPLVVGVTRGPRLKRTAQTLRDAAERTEDARQKAILLSLHQNTVAQIVSSQLVPWWRVWGPVAGMAFVSAGSFQLGHSAFQWTSTHPTFEFVRFANEVAGDFIGLSMAGLIGPVMVAWLWESFEWTVGKRGRLACDYIQESGEVERVNGLTRDDERKKTPPCELAQSLGRALAAGVSVIYGSAAAGVLVAGMASRDDTRPIKVSGLEGIAILVVALAFTALSFVVISLLTKRQELPGNHPSGTYTLPLPAQPAPPPTLRPRRWLRRCG